MEFAQFCVIIRIISKHKGSFISPLISLKIRPSFEAAQLGNQVVRELANALVVVPGCFVEAIALRQDAVLAASQLCLKGEILLIGFQVGVVFYCDEKAVQGVAQFPLGRFIAGELKIVEVVRVDLNRCGSGAGLRDSDKGTLLVFSVVLYQSDKVRHEVGAALVDIFHLSPCRSHGFLLFDQAVVGADAPNEEDTHNDKD